MKSDVIIIGGGVLGLSLAYHLAKEKTHVTIIEKEATYGAHASSKNAGMIRTLYRHSQLTDWALRSISLWPEELKVNAFRTTSSLIVGRTLPSHHEHFFNELEIITHHQGKPKSLPAVHSRFDGLLDPGVYLNNLCSLIDKKYASLILKSTVKEISFANDTWEIFSETGSFTAPILVNAAGAWINSFLSNHPHFLVSAEPFARHLYVVTGFNKNYMPAADCGFYWDEHSEWYLREWDATSRLVSICDKISAHPDTYIAQHRVAETLATKLLDALPAIADTLSLSRSWHCFRTYTEDQLPIWGPDTDNSQLFWLAAFGGFGMSTSFAAAYDAAQYLLGREPLVTKDFLPDRVKTSTLAIKSIG